MKKILNYFTFFSLYYVLRVWYLSVQTSHMWTVATLLDTQALTDEFSVCVVYHVFVCIYLAIFFGEEKKTDFSVTP